MAFMYVYISDTNLFSSHFHGHSEKLAELEKSTLGNGRP